jgi:branched-subunit amino acid aminotransferase/4-amino-4-deoxychorismate lyase
VDLHRAVLHERHHPWQGDRGVPAATVFPATRKTFSLFDVYGADEAFVTGTFGGLTPVTKVDGRLIGSGSYGPMTRRLQGLYEELVHEAVAAAKQ